MEILTYRKNLVPLTHMKYWQIISKNVNTTLKNGASRVTKRNYDYVNNPAEEIWGEPYTSGRLPTSFVNGKG